MDKKRGVILLIAGLIAIGEAIMLLHGQKQAIALALGAAAIALGLWRLLRTPPEPRAPSSTSSK